MKKIMLLVVAFVFLVKIECSALTIIRDFSQVGTAPTNSTGTGNFTNICNAACDYWESVILDPVTITNIFEYDFVGGGQHDVLAMGGKPPRETLGLIRFNNNNKTGSFSWYLDPSPLVCNESTNTTYYEESSDLGCGQINASRFYT